MAMLLFQVGNNRYVIDNQFISRVVPLVNLNKSMPYESPAIAGLLNLGGELIPVIDFCQLIEHRPAVRVFHSRIILLRNPQGSQKDELVGLIGEKITEIVDLSPSKFVDPSFYLHHLPYLDGIYSDEQGIIQRIDIKAFFDFVGRTIFNSKVEL